VESAGAADIVPAGVVKDGSDDSKDFGREFSAAFESFASLSLDSKGCKVGGGGEGKVEQKFSSASYRTPSVSMAESPKIPYCFFLSGIEHSLAGDGTLYGR
jgi:hypothetical protein